VGGNEIPPQAVDLAIAFFAMIAVIIIGLPLARAFARRLDRKAVPPAINQDVVAQLQRIEHGIEAMAIEVERISEAQRYMARLQSERTAEPAALPQSGARE
jgi:UDP-N-acetyl-D-mannosaminuronate dehydrogenase